MSWEMEGENIVQAIKSDKPTLVELPNPGPKIEKRGGTAPTLVISAGEIDVAVLP